jgi:dihydrofolate synthase/folylpolyglutamate synthase
LFLPLFGSYQAGNAACALAAVEAFSGAAGSPSPSENGTADRDTDDELEFSGAGDQGELVLSAVSIPSVAVPGTGALDPEMVAAAFATMTSPGRLEIVRRSPVVVVDAAHNPAGMAATVSAVNESFGAAEVIAVVGVSADKDVAGILDELEPLAAAVVLTTNSSPRSMSASDLAALATPVFGPDRVHVAERLDDAIEVAVGLADEASADLAGPLAGLLTDGADVPLETAGTVVLITGSVVTAGDAKLLLSGGR